MVSYKAKVDAPEPEPEVLILIVVEDGLVLDLIRLYWLSIS